LVKQQRHLFDSLWDIAIPLSARNKELEYQQDSHYQKTLTNPEDIKREINDVIQQCRKELLIISSTKLLNHLHLSNDFLLQISDLLKRGVCVRV
jgi:sugar-specific transcriptional regulator TrmB